MTNDPLKHRTNNLIKSLMPTYDDALALFHEWTKTESLRRHAYAVEAAMEYYAQKFGEDVELWRLTGLLHDMDYDKYPTAEEHPFVAVEHLRERGDVDEGIIEAILGHADYSGVARESSMAKVLFAVDELAGFIGACCKVRPNGIADLAPKSVKKKLKDKPFAAAVSRTDIQAGIEALGVDPTEHIQTCIDALRADAVRLCL